MLLGVQGCCWEFRVLLGVQGAARRNSTHSKLKMQVTDMTKVGWRPCGRFVPVRVETLGALIDESAHSERERTYFVLSFCLATRR